METPHSLVNQTYNVTLQIPSNIGNASLEIELEWDTEEENVTYTRGGPKYNFFKDEKTWNDAENICEIEGRHLASVHSDEEDDEIKYGDIWLGGKDEEDGGWKWSDGTELLYQNWDAKHPNKDEGCLLMWNGKWRSINCDQKKPFFCVNHPGII